METFQQNALEYPAPYEKISDVNNKAPAAEASCGDLRRRSVCINSFFCCAAIQEKEADIICTIGPKSWDPEVGGT